MEKKEERCASLDLVCLPWFWTCATRVFPYLEDLLLVMTLLSLEEFCYMLETLILMP